MSNQVEVISSGATYFLEGNIGAGEECEYVSTGAENELQVFGTDMPESNGVFVAEEQDGVENSWAFKNNSTGLYLMRNESNNNAEATSPEPVYFITLEAGEEEVYNLSLEAPDGDQLYLSMLDDQQGSQITFAEYKDEGQSKQKWKFIKSKGGRDIPSAYGG